MTSSSTTLPAVSGIKNPLLAFITSENKEGGLERLKALLNTKDSFTSAEAKTYGTTPLIELIKQYCTLIEDPEPGDHRIEMLKEMIRLVASSPVKMINFVDIEGITALGIVIQTSDNVLLPILLENGADSLQACKLAVDGTEAIPFEFVMRMSFGTNNFDKFGFIAKHLPMQLRETAEESKLSENPRVMSILKNLTFPQRTKMQKFATSNKISWLITAFATPEGVPAKVAVAQSGIEIKESKKAATVHKTIKVDAPVATASSNTDGPKDNKASVLATPDKKVESPPIFVSTSEDKTEKAPVVAIPDKKVAPPVPFTILEGKIEKASVKKVEAKIEECKDLIRLREELDDFKRAVDAENVAAITAILNLLKNKNAQFKSPVLDYVSPNGKTALGLAVMAADKAAKTYSSYRSDNREQHSALQLIEKLLEFGVSPWTKFKPARDQAPILPLIYAINKQSTGIYDKSKMENELKTIHSLINKIDFSKMSVNTDESERIDLCLFALDCFERKDFEEKYWERSELPEEIYQEHRQRMSCLLNGVILSVAPANGVPFEILAQDKGFNPLLLAIELNNPRLMNVVMNSFSPEQGTRSLYTPLMKSIEGLVKARQEKDSIGAREWLTSINTFLTKWGKEMVNQRGASLTGLGWKQYEGYTPLSVAMKLRLPEIVTLLLVSGAYPDLPYPVDRGYNITFTTALHHAILFALGEGDYDTPSVNSSELIIPLLDQGATGGDYKFSDETPIGIVAAHLNKKETKDEEKRNLKAVGEALLEKPELVKSWLNLPQKEYTSGTPLGNLLLSGQIEFAKKLILAGAPLAQTFRVERPSFYRSTADAYPLQHACYLGNIDLINCMLAQPYKQFSNKEGRFEYSHCRNIFLLGGVCNENAAVFRTLMDSPKFECVLSSPDLCTEILDYLVKNNHLERLDYLLQKSITLTQESFFQVLNFLRESINNSSSQTNFNTAFECLKHLLNHPQMRGEGRYGITLNLSDSKILELFDNQSTNPIASVLKPYVDGLEAVYRISDHLRKPVAIVEGSRKVRFADLASVRTALTYINQGGATSGTAIGSSSSSSSHMTLFGGTAYNVVEDHKAAKQALESAATHLHRVTSSYS